MARSTPEHPLTARGAVQPRTLRRSGETRDGLRLIYSLGYASAHPAGDTGWLDHSALGHEISGGVQLGYFRDGWLFGVSMGLDLPLPGNKGSSWNGGGWFRGGPVIRYSPSPSARSSPWVQVSLGSTSVRTSTVGTTEQGEETIERHFDGFEARAGGAVSHRLSRRIAWGPSISLSVRQLQKSGYRRCSRHN